MTSSSIVIQQPRQAAQQLILLFHGVGASAASMAPLGQQLARAFPDAFVVSVDGAHSSDLGAGRQWFSVRGVTEENRPERIAAAMPAFQAAVLHWQEQARVDAAHTTLVGFSQGAIMALESTQLAEPVAARVVALAGRLARPARTAAGGSAIHLIHGEQDPVIAPACSIDAASELEALGATVTLDLIPALGHGIDVRVLERVIERLRGRS